MKKKITLLLVVFLGLMISCNEDKKSHEEIQKRQMNENVILLKEKISKPFIGDIFALGIDEELCYDVLKEYFPDLNPTTAEITYGNDTYYLFGKDCSEENCVIMRISLEVFEGDLYLNKNVAMGETCTGEPCSHCSFKDGGGCQCNDTHPNGNPNAGRTCNHTITKLTPANP